MRDIIKQFIYYKLMENNIILPNENYNFENITVLSPSSIQGKTFLSKIQNNNDDLYIQTPKCISKNSFITSGKKTYIDLLFEKDNDVFIEWFENLENKIQSEIYNKRERWFRGENIEKNDIEDIFTSPIRTYKSGKYYLIRVYLGSPRVIQHSPLNIFDENENPVAIEDITCNTKMITILQIHGLKFNTNINFQIYIELKQILVIDEEKIFQKPLFKVNTSASSIKTNKDNNTIIPSLDTNNDDIDNIDDITEDVSIKETNNNSNILETNNNSNILETNNNSNILETNNISNDLEELNSLEENIIPNNLEENMISNNLEEFNPDINEDTDSFTIKKPNDVYIELYKDAKEKAKKARMDAIKAYLELKHIKQNYQISEVDSDDEFSESEFQSSDEEYEVEESPKLDFEELM